MRKLLALGLLAGCHSQPQTQEPVRMLPDTPAAVAQSHPAAPAPRQPPASVAPDEEAPDSLRAFLGVRPMRFRVVSAADVEFFKLNTPRADSVTDWFRVVHELSTMPRIVYRTQADPTRWLQFRLEPVGKAGMAGGNFIAEPVRLDAQRQVLRLHLQGHAGFWGGHLDYGQTALVDVTAEPQLLLKTETQHEDTGYGRENDTVFNDGDAGSEGREQEVSVQNELIVLGQPTGSSQQGREGLPRLARLWPIPASMLPAGRYRYQGGRLVRVAAK